MKILGSSGSRVLRYSGSVLLAGAVAHSAQQIPPQRPPVFRGEAVLVTVDVYPQKDGLIVEGLKASDFQVLEDGKPQTVENAEFVRVEPVLSESERRDPNSISEMLQIAADPHNRVFVVFLDMLHVSVGGSHASRRPLVDSLNRIIGEKDLFGVMTQNTDPRALTLGRRLLTIEEQLTKYWTWGERNRLLSDPADLMEETLKSCFEVKPILTFPPWFISDNGQQRLLYELLVDRRREDRTLTALEKLVDQLGSMREARTVTLVITEGWRLFRQDPALADEAKYYGPQAAVPGSSGGRITLGDKTPNANFNRDVKACVDELARLSLLDDPQRLRDLTLRANRANVSFYPVNPSGLVVFDTPISEKSPPSLVEDLNRSRNRRNGLEDLASATDGIAVLNTNDMAAGLKKIIDDVSAYYLLGYYSTNTTHDGKYRRIEVKTKTPGLNVRARRGYYAPRNKAVREVFTPAPAGPEPPKGLDAALGELGRLRVSADVFTRGALLADHADIVVEIASARAGAMPWSGGADASIVVTPGGGAPLAPVTARIDSGARSVLVRVPLPESAGQIRVVSKVTAAGESLEDTVELARMAGPIVGEPMLYRGRPAATSPLRPVADLQYRRIERVHVEWPVTGEVDQRSARLLGKNGQPLAIPVTVTERETDGRRVIAADLNLAPLSFGDYVIELTAGRRTETVVRLVAFRVVQ
jgi:VWFA-related protein